MQPITVQDLLDTYIDTTQSIYLFDFVNKKAFGGSRKLTRKRLSLYTEQLKTFYVVRIEGMDFQELYIKFVRKEDLAKCASEEPSMRRT
nr:MAG TPA: hypothetical protein [Bacteriophage sp.]